MSRILRKAWETLLPRLLRVSFSGTNPLLEFSTWETIRLNQRRLEHLACLDLPLAGKSVLEVGAGIGNLTDFFVDRGCRVVTTEARDANLRCLRARFPALDVRSLDLDHPGAAAIETFDIVFCYGLLYHLAQPDAAIAYLAGHSSDLLLLETCVSFGDEMAVNPCAEPADHVTQATSGMGCRPTRPWVAAQLRAHFEFVYFPATQPHHDQFPTDWDRPHQHTAPYARAVFVASRRELASPQLLTHMPRQQSRH